MMNKVKSLRFIGIAEGISFLVLLLIAMPLKYYFGLPMAVKVVGWMHGVLFILYIAIVLLAVKAMEWSFMGVMIALAASLIPGGTFVLDRSWKKREAALKQAAEE